MNKAELVAAVAGKTGVSETEVDCVLHTLLDTVTEELHTGGSVTIVGFGTIKAVEHAAREARNPVTGEKVKVPACTAVTFHAGKGLKEAVNK
ncbi:MAG: HU family DNA-binding protein [Coprobacillus sp.]|nr:HU family DNA-binding protein [Coprobacillus sp.]